MCRQSTFPSISSPRSFVWYDIRWDALLSPNLGGCSEALISPCICECVSWVCWELKPSLCSNPPILFRSAVQIQGNVLPSQSLWPHSALPAEPRDSPSLKDTVTLTLSPSMSLARTKAIWGAAESFSNKITLSICTLHGSDCRALRSPIPRLLLDLLRSSNPGLHDWLQLKAPHARGGSQKHCETQKRPPAHQTKLHSLKAMGNRENEKEGSKRKKSKNKKKDKSLHSLCDPPRQKNKLHFCVMAPEGQNRHRVPLSPVCVRACWYRFHQFPQESQRGAQAYISAFHLDFFCIPLHWCVLSLPSIGRNWLLLFQTALSLLMPQVSGLCTPWEPGLERAATNLPR